MFSLETLVMLVLAAIAVYIAYTKLSCHLDDPRITWLPEAPDGSGQEAPPESNPAHLHR